MDRASRRILGHIGIQVSDDSFLNILENAGAQVDRKKNRVRFKPGWLDYHLKQSPPQVTLYSRDGRNDVHLGNGSVHFTNGGRVFRFRDGKTGQYRYTMLRHIAHTAALIENLNNISFYVIACQAHTIKPEVYYLNDFFHSFNNTTKHVMGGCDDIDGVKQVWDLASFIAGGEDKFNERPFASIIVNPISPLIMDSNMLGVLQFCCTHGIPVTCDSAPIAGATAPATLAGTLAQMHAETLASVAIAQVFSLGSKVLYGAVPTIMDLRKMDITMGSVEMAMMNAAAVQLARLYNLPIYASAGLTEAKKPDIQAGVEKAISSLTVAMAGADCIHLAAGMLDSGNSISYAQYVIDNEILGTIKRLLSGIRVNSNTIGFDVIKNVGPGGHFVTEDHTVEHMMDEFFYPELSVRCNFDTWEELGRPDMISRAREVVTRTLGGRSHGLLDRGLIARTKKTFPGIQIAQ
ncbi:trimethylamine methyltransferase family protein [Chloroflexota bacterium]